MILHAAAGQSNNPIQKAMAMRSPSGCSGIRKDLNKRFKKYEEVYLIVF